MGMFDKKKREHSPLLYNKCMMSEQLAAIIPNRKIRSKFCYKANRVDECRVTFLMCAEEWYEAYKERFGDE